MLLLAAAVLLHGLAFALLLDRPLSLGALRRELDAKLAYAARLPTPRLVIIAGSNALYSHRCEVIGPMLTLPCVNGGVAVGLGLDYQFLRWERLLRPGDIVYLPMELQQYALTRQAVLDGPDTAIMLRHDRTSLLALSPQRWPPAALSGTLEDTVLSLVEEAATALRPGLAAHSLGDIDPSGDATGNSLARAIGNRGFLGLLHRPDPSPGAVLSGYGTTEIAAFLDWSAAHGVRAIGGWPTEFADAPQEASLGAAICRVFAEHHAAFLPLSGKGRYPRADFFDTQDHLVEECQLRHSIRVARALGKLLQGGVTEPPGWVASRAVACPTSAG